MYLISIIIFVDILFITFWAGASTSLQSIIVSWITDPASFNANFITLALKSLFATITAGALTAVVVALSGAKTDTVLFSAFASGTLYNIGKDYLVMYQEVANINTILALVLIVPFMIMFAFIVVEWLRGKD